MAEQPQVNLSPTDCACPGNCPSCGGPARRSGYRGLSLGHCTLCGLQYWIASATGPQAEYYNILYAPRLGPDHGTDAEPDFADYVRRLESVRNQARSATAAEHRVKGRTPAPSRPPRSDETAVLGWLERMPRGRMLDVGCGEGSLVRWALDKGWDAIGCDIAAVAIAAARKAGPSSRFYCGQPKDLPEELGAFDGVTALHVLEHFPNPHMLFDSLGSRLRRGGWAVLTMPNRHRIGLLVRRMRRQPWQAWDLPPHHFTRWSRRALRSFLSNYFEEMAITCSRYGRLGLLDSVLSWQWGPNLVAECRSYTG